ncbi:MAG: LamG domain-containing protein [Sedimentisphaerales bacterium]|nr:LamG domain-containing protein [Sedimentisphaerales bacterium]
MMRNRLIYLVSFSLVLGIVDITSALEVKINFQDSESRTPEGYLPDIGEIFGDRGNDYSYGWDQDIQNDARERNANTDQRYDTVVQMQEGDPRTWEIELPDGSYELFIACGDASYDDQINTIDVEGTILTDPDGRSYFDEYYVSVFVRDGRLTIKPAPGGIKCKILFLHISTLPILKAYDPFPENNTIYSDVQVTLGWTAGDFAASHDVYIGDNFDDVDNGTGDAFKGNYTENYFVVENLTPGATYYWRIDEVNELHSGSPWKGDIWTFSVPISNASNPNPPDGVEYIYPNVTLSWTPGLGAQSHIVYIGSNFDEVDNATGGESREGTSYTPAPLVKETVYYWRVDEYDGTETHKGDIWSFTTIPNVPIADPNLLCWWKFDEVVGDTVLDSSGYDRYGTVHGASLELAGQIGSALYFGGDGDYVVDEDAEDYLNGLSAITVCMWIKADTMGNDLGIFDGVEPNNRDSMVTMRFDSDGASYGGLDVIKMGVTSTSEDGVVWEQQLESSSDAQTTRWMHVAMTWSSGNIIRFYMDGVQDTPSGTTDPNNTGGTISDCTKLIIGRGGKDIGTTSGWKGLIDDVRVYNIALDYKAIMQVMRGESDLAWNSSPVNGSTPDLAHTLPLSWSSGENAAQHDVYFGTDRDAVDGADTSDTTGVYRGRQSGTSYNPPEGVEWGSGPYYWRIDEYNSDSTITKGRLWQFTVADFILIDDIESYNDYETEVEGSNRIYLTWLDGYDNPTQNGSVIGYAEPDFAAGKHFVEADIVHSGRQSMPYFYDNSVASSSKATMTLDYPRNWTEQDVGVLSLWFKGYPADFLEEPAGTYMISAAGADIGGIDDEFRYVYKRLSGAGSIQAHVLSMDDTDEWAKAGVMIRRSLDSGSPFAGIFITPGNGCRFQARLNIGEGLSSDTAVATPEQRTITAPYWVKIERDNSNNFYGYYSSDGTNWQPMAWNPQFIVMPQDVYIGFVVTSHNTNAVCKATFSNVQTAGSVSPATWTQEVIGTTMQNNDPEPMFVGIANKNGPTRVVYHDDVKAAQIDSWTRWDIDLSKFSSQGVNLTSVDNITIGFGDLDGPQTGGSGLVFFDDIRLYRSE